MATQLCRKNRRVAWECWVGFCQSIEREFRSISWLESPWLPWLSRR